MLKLQEISELQRVHEISSFYKLNEKFFVVVNIIREGIADSYDIEISEDIYDNNDKTIEYIASINSNLIVI